MAITVNKFASPLGAEVVGVDCSKPLDAGSVEEITDAWHENLVIVFRDQKLDDEQLMAFSRNFGELDMAPPNPSGKPWIGEHPELNVLTNIREDGELTGSHGNAEVSWHSDLGYNPVPPSASILCCIDCPPSGGDTWFANMYMAYETLLGELNEIIEGLEAIHDMSTNGVGDLRAGFKRVIDPRDAPGAHHPLVRIHPETHRKSLFLPRRLNGYILGLDLKESERVLDELWVHAVRREHTWGHQWRRGDVLMWDNRCCLHRRDVYDDSHTRLMHRTQIKGTEPPIPAWRAVSGV